MAGAGGFRNFTRLLLLEVADKLALEHIRLIEEVHADDTTTDAGASYHKRGEFWDNTDEKRHARESNTSVVGSISVCDEALNPPGETHAAQDAPVTSQPKRDWHASTSDYVHPLPNLIPAQLSGESGESVIVTDLPEPRTLSATAPNSVRKRASDATLVRTAPSSNVGQSTDFGTRRLVVADARVPFDPDDLHRPRAQSQISQSTVRTASILGSSSIISKGSIFEPRADRRSRLNRGRSLSFATTSVKSSTTELQCEAASNRAQALGAMHERGTAGSLVSQAVFEGLDFWKDVGALNFQSAKSKMQRSLSKARAFDVAPSFLSGTSSMHDSEVSRFVMLPNTLKRMAWDLMSVAVALHDTCTSPLHFVRSVQTPFMLAWIARIFWSCDILASFLTAFELQNGRNEMRFVKIAKHYAKRWLLFDASLVIVDWMEVLVFSRDDALSVLPVLRMGRLLRVARLYAAWNTIFEHYSDKVLLMASVANNICGILLVVHVIACCWVGLESRQNGWVSHVKIDGNDGWQQYATGFHWALSQFYGSMEISPTNAMERWFAIGTLLLGFVLATVFVSNITSSMTRLHIITSEQSVHLKVLRRYLRDRNISYRLAARVQVNAQHALKQQECSVAEDAVELLKFVSEPLKVELHSEIYSPVLCAHPLFFRMKGETIMNLLCHTGVSMQVFSPDDVLFRPGELPICPRMLFVLQGQLSYSQGRLSESQVLPQGEPVYPEEWVCEHVLWTLWVHHGLLYAETASQLAILNADVFFRLMENNQSFAIELSTYAAEFVQALNKSPASRSDLGRSVNVREIMSCAFPRVTDSHRTSIILEAIGWPRSQPVLPTEIAADSGQ